MIFALAIFFFEVYLKGEEITNEGQIRGQSQQGGESGTQLLLLSCVSTGKTVCRPHPVAGLLMSPDTDCMIPAHAPGEGRASREKGI